MGCNHCSHQGATPEGDECPTCHGTGNDPNGVRYDPAAYWVNDAGQIVRLPLYRDRRYVGCANNGKRVTIATRRADARQGFHGLHTCDACGARTYWARTIRPDIYVWCFHLQPVENMLSLFDPSETITDESETETDERDTTPPPF